MKRILYLFLENSPVALEAMQAIKDSGFNGTVVETISLRHAMEGNLPEETHFFSLMNWNVMNDQESTLSMYLVDEERVDALKEAIREHTDGFKKVKGAMFTKKIEDYEGTI